MLSPRPRIGLVEEKVSWYARYGVRECWLVDLGRRQIAVLTLADGRVASRTHFTAEQGVESAVLGGLALRPADVLGWW